VAIPDFIQEALDRAPPAVDDLYEDEIAEVERRAAEIGADRVRTIPHEEVQKTIAAMRPLAG
jgi:hypothetical protein